MRIKKFVLRTGAGMLFLLAMLSAGLYGYSRSGHARTLAMNRINAAIPGTLSAGQIRLLAEAPCCGSTISG